MVKIKNLYKTYSTGNTKVEALKGLDVTVDKGDIFGFIGLSGAGKTSLVRCMSGLETATSGEIWIDDVEMTKISGHTLRELRKQLGMVFQHFNLLMNSNVYDNVAFPLAISKKSKAYRKEKVEELLDLVGLSDKATAYPAQLSGGQKQRVGIARALAADPKLVICDEATSALDPATTESILHLIKDINRKMGITFIIITHEMDVIKEICTKVAIMEDGRIIEAGNVADIYVHPQTETARIFFKTGEIDLNHTVYQVAKQAEGDIVKATFVGSITAEPFIANVIKMYDVSVSILAGNIQEISDTVIGWLIIKISGEAQAVKDSIEYLNSQNVKTEVIHHV